MLKSLSSRVFFHNPASTTRSLCRSNLTTSSKRRFHYYHHRRAVARRRPPFTTRCTVFVTSFRSFSSQSSIKPTPASSAHSDYNFHDMALPSAQERLSSFRALMTKLKVDCFIASTNDAHQSEYVCNRDKRLGFLSGFTGSAGTIVVTQKEALLWTDGL